MDSVKVTSIGLISLQSFEGKGKIHKKVGNISILYEKQKNFSKYTIRSASELNTRRAINFPIKKTFRPLYSLRWQCFCLYLLNDVRRYSGTFCEKLHSWIKWIWDKQQPWPPGTHRCKMIHAYNVYQFHCIYSVPQMDYLMLRASHSLS